MQSSHRSLARKSLGSSEKATAEALTETEFVVMNSFGEIRPQQGRLAAGNAEADRLPLLLSAAALERFKVLHLTEFSYPQQTPP